MSDLYKKFAYKLTHSRISKKYEDSWALLNNNLKLSPNIIDKHFSETETYGVVLGPKEKNFICLDFDYQRQQTRSNYDQLVKFATGLFQCPKLLLTSSQSNNRHCYLFYKQQDPFLARDRIVNVLKGEGIHPKPGFVEVISSTNLRLPFGKGSNLLDLSTLNKLHLTKEQQLEIFTNHLCCKRLPSIYDATPSYEFIESSPAFKEEAYLEELKYIIKYGLPGEGTRNASFLTYAIYLAKQGKDEDEITDTLIEFIEEHGDLSKEYRANPYSVRKKAREVARCIINREILGTTKNSAQKVDKWCCDIIFDNFFKFKYSGQKAVFDLFKFIKSNVINGRNLIPISRSFKYETLNLNSRNYRQIFYELEELELLVCKTKGDNIRGKSNLYKWIGPPFSEGTGYTEFFDFLYKNQYNKNYTNYIQKVILKDRKGTNKDALSAQ